jgi:Mg2+ and Co2+ transporter CorA
MYQQIQNIANKVVKAAENCLFAADTAKKSLMNIASNPKAISKNENDVQKDIHKAEEMINDLDKLIKNWVEKYNLQSSMRTLL